MGVRVASADSLPYVCVEYVCACGATAHGHGAKARFLPRGWIRVEAPGRRGETAYVCPRCAAAERPGERRPA